MRVRCQLIQYLFYKRVRSIRDVVAVNLGSTQKDCGSCRCLDMQNIGGNGTRRDNACLLTPITAYYKQYAEQVILSHLSSSTIITDSNLHYSYFYTSGCYNGGTSPVIRLSILY